MTAHRTLPGPLAGRKVLIVEGRYFIADDLAREVDQLGGAVVGPYPRSHTPRRCSTMWMWTPPFPT